MKHSIQEHIETLQKARIHKKLSQSALAKTIGIQQGHLSKIEQGVVDLQLSSFIEMARALDLEVMLIPRQSSIGIQNLLNAHLSDAGTEIIKPLYGLDEEGGDE